MIRKRVWKGIILCPTSPTCPPSNPLLRKKEEEENNLIDRVSKGNKDGHVGHSGHTPSEVLNGGICNVCGEYDNCLIINYQDGIARCRECIKIDNLK